MPLPFDAPTIPLARRKLTNEERLRLEVCQGLTCVAEELVLHEVTREQAADLLKTLVLKLEPR